MRNMKTFFFLLSLAVLVFALCPRQTAAQTNTTGDLTGAVTDPTGGVVPSVTVKLRSVAQGATRETKTNDAGVYRFSLLPTGQYEVSIQASGFQALSSTTTVNIGQVTTLDLKLSLGATTEKVVVIEEAPLVETQSGDLAATLDERTIQNMPNQGNDMSYPLEMTPGVTENTLAGYGNYSVNGMSATANLFTLNGMDDNDPYLSLNNTGATSLMLGQNEVQEATIEANSYGGQYGTLAGSNVNFVTKSGTNQFHGEAKYFWTGRAFAANSFFNNANGAPKSFSNANQYGGDAGGPILKDKLWWFFDTEGIRLITPSSAPTVLVPDSIGTGSGSNTFEAATIANLNALGLSKSVAFYQNMFTLYNAAAKAGNAVPGDAGGGPGCGNITINTQPKNNTTPFKPTLGGSAVPYCVDHFRTSSVLRTNEALYAGRLDYAIGAEDHIFGRVQSDNGFQGSYTDPISPLFNLVSPQPEYQGQLIENHIFGPTATNQFVLSGQWYSATFNQPNRPAAVAAFPTSLIMGDGSLTTLGGIDFISPQGRNVSQAQVSDDVTKTVSRHTLKFGVKYRRNDVTDMVYGQNTSGTMVAGDLDAFYSGGFDPAFTDQSAGVLNTTSYSALFPANGEQRFKFWNVGGYAEDDIQIRSNLTITLALRGDHFSDPTCKNLCFARLVEPFNQLVNDPVLGGTNAANVPYNQVITLNNRTALNGLTNIQWAPRFGFAWQPFGREHNTVVRGGIGIFYNSFPGQVVDNISENPPLAPTFTVGSGAQPLYIATLPQTNNLVSAAAASSAAFQAGFTSGLTEAQLATQIPGFAKPSMNYTLFTNAPQYQKWSLEIEQGFGPNNSITVAYSGNHGIHEPVQNSALNAYGSGFAGLPTTAPDPRFGYVEGVFSEGVSNYNGLSISATHRYSSGQISASYTWSHALDQISNGGFSPLAYTSFFSTNTSPIFPQDPNNLRGMYGNADYDVRHYFSLQYLWELPIKRLTFGHGPDGLVKGWNVSGTLMARSGLPFTVVDEGTTTTLEGTNYGQVFGGGGTPAPLVFASVGTGSPGTCSGPGSDVTKPCFNTAAFATSGTGFGTVGRNTMRGPGYFDTDFSVWKSMKVIPHNESAEFDLGFQIYNLFNHPNFDNPVYNVASTNFGTLQRTISPATTVYGVALGADASMRIAQLKAQFRF